MTSSVVRKVDAAQQIDEYLDDDGFSELKRQCEQLNTPPQVANYIPTSSCVSRTETDEHDAMRRGWEAQALRATLTGC